MSSFLIKTASYGDLKIKQKALGDFFQRAIKSAGFDQIRAIVIKFAMHCCRSFLLSPLESQWRFLRPKYLHLVWITFCSANTRAVRERSSRGGHGHVVFFQPFGRTCAPSAHNNTVVPHAGNKASYLLCLGDLYDALRRVSNTGLWSKGQDHHFPSIRPNLFLCCQENIFVLPTTLGFVYP